MTIACDTMGEALARFSAEALTRHEGFWLPSRAVYTAWNQWCRLRDIPPALGSGVYINVWAREFRRASVYEVRMVRQRRRGAKKLCAGITGVELRSDPLDLAATQLDHPGIIRRGSRLDCYDRAYWAILSWHADGCPEDDPRGYLRPGTMAPAELPPAAPAPVSTVVLDYAELQCIVDTLKAQIGRMQKELDRANATINKVSEAGLDAYWRGEALAAQAVVRAADDLVATLAFIRDRLVSLGRDKLPPVLLGCLEAAEKSLDKYASTK